MEELKIKFREYYWEFGKSPFQEDEDGDKVNWNRGDCTMDNAHGNGNNGNLGVANKSNSRCGVHGCKAKAMAMTRFCHMHILSDAKQKLYKAFNFSIKRPNLSISPEESWLPIASILLCIAHVQLEASIKNGDIQGFQLFKGETKSLAHKKNDRKYEEDREKGRHNLSSAPENFRNQIKGWNDPQKLVQGEEHSSEDEEYDD